MEGLFRDALSSCCPGVLVACAVWLLSGWERGDRETTLRRYRLRLEGSVTGWEKRASRACRAMLQRVGVQLRPRGVVGFGEVAEMIDIVRLGLSSGLSFDASLELYCEGRSDALAARMEQALISWRAGLSSREDELRSVARDFGSTSLEVFALSVSQALELGAPLAETLEGQSGEIRAAHRAEVERRIELAPVKLLIPTGALILPALLLSILGPLLAASGML